MSNSQPSEGKPTARKGLRSKNAERSSPSLPESPSQTRSRINTGQSPQRRDTIESKNWSDVDQYSDTDGDTVDRVSQKESPKLYPDIEDELKKYDSETRYSPSSNRNDSSFDDSYATANSHCVPQSGPSGKRKVLSKLPVTPEKGSPGRRIHQTHEHMEKRPRRRGMMPILAIGFFLLVGFSLIFFFYSLKNVEEISKPKPRIKTIEEIFRDIKRELRTLNSQFSQTKHFWIQLIGQLESIMKQDPIQPAVILAVVPEGADRTAVCLLHQISHAVSNSFEGDAFVMFDVKSELPKGAHHLKYNLHQHLLGLEKSHAAIVHNVEKIPGTAAMTFHAFCDNENAPFKQALIFLALSLPGKYEDLSEERLADTIDDYLLGLWGEELPQKDVSAVVSRVANAPVLIKPEQTSILETVCANI